ncbi:hypothetical protein BCR33DRAFT_716283 [Rhizoclosmatium globosum]|uniref:SH3 domain-containing protein n=1 Tax=Rhizoclosmatium globosum TaxID=329046 RepID=A0A1Y2CF08_9FUNG|nr:hypothetical protein BCR33DRAFT_716283 [Rhizoclosmatium globosum]|eukprot:ORY45641.1 hypothetical protein BCR33DRAFT_716283 [Rhizoclosmatium globosum]
MFIPRGITIDHQDHTSSNESTYFLNNVPLPAIVGAACGVALIVVAGFIAYQRRRSGQQQLAQLSPLDAPLSLPPLKKQSSPKQENASFHTDPIAEMTAVGIHLPTRMNSEPLASTSPTTGRKSNKPKIISSTTPRSPFKKLSIFSNTSTDDLPLKAVIIPRRTMSISGENPGGPDARRRSHLLSNAIAAAKESAAIASRGGKLPSFSSSSSSSTSATVNAVLAAHHNNTLPDLPETVPASIRDSVVSDASSLSIESITPDETRYEVVDPWIPQRFDEIELFPGDFVVVYQVFGDGWCDGKVEGTEETGAFPLACLKGVDGEGVGAGWGVGGFVEEEEEEEEEGERRKEGRDVDVESLAGSGVRQSLVSQISTKSSVRSGSSSASDSAASSAATTLSVKTETKHRYSGLLRNIDKYVEEEPK